MSSVRKQNLSLKKELVRINEKAEKNRAREKQIVADAMARCTGVDLTPYEVPFHEIKCVPASAHSLPTSANTSSTTRRLKRRLGEGEEITERAPNLSLTFFLFF
jgi:hypothetical protein